MAGPTEMSVAGAIPLRQAPTKVAELFRSTREVMEPQAKAHDVTLSVETGDDAPGFDVLLHNDHPESVHSYVTS